MKLEIRLNKYRYLFGAVRLCPKGAESLSPFGAGPLGRLTGAKQIQALGYALLAASGRGLPIPPLCDALPLRGYCTELV
jgi:hypothetical protein